MQILDAAWKDFSVKSAKSPQDQKATILLCESMEKTAIQSLGEIVVYSSDVTVQREIFMTLIKLAATRPSLVEVLTSTLASIATRKGYPSLKAFISDDIEHLINCWMKLGFELINIPLVMCDPDVQVELLSCGLTGTQEDYRKEEVAAFTQHAPANEDIELDIDQLHVDSLHDFLLETAVMLVPIELMRMSRDHDMEKTVETYGWLRLKETSTLLIGDESDESIAKLIRTNLHSIYGYVFPLIYSGDEQVKVEGSRMLITIQRLVSSDIIDRATHKIPHLIVLRLLKLLSSRCFENDDGTRQMENKAFFEGIQWVADQVIAGKGAKDKERISVFAAANTSSSEILLHLKSWFETVYSSSSLSRHLMTLEHVLKTLIEEETEGLGMAMHTVLALLEDVKLIKAGETLRVLGMVEDLLSRIGERGGGGVEMVVNDAVLTLINVYERETIGATEEAKAGERRFRFESIESIGLLGLSEGGGTRGDGIWGWDGDVTKEADASRMRTQAERQSSQIRGKVLKVRREERSDEALRMPHRSRSLHLAPLLTS